MNLADPARVKPADRKCPDRCPWGVHPENPSWQRCGMHDCQIERPAPGARVAETATGAPFACAVGPNATDGIPGRNGTIQQGDA